MPPLRPPGPAGRRPAALVPPAFAVVPSVLAAVAPGRRRRAAKAAISPRLAQAAAGDNDPPVELDGRNNR